MVRREESLQGEDEIIERIEFNFVIQVTELFRDLFINLYSHYVAIPHLLGNKDIMLNKTLH